MEKDNMALLHILISILCINQGCRSCTKEPIVTHNYIIVFP